MKRLTRISETSLATSTTWQIFISCKYFICYDESGNVKIKLLHFVSFCILFVVIINVLFCSEKEFARKEFFIKLKEKEGQIFIVNSVVFANFVSCVIHYSESVMYLMVCKRTITPLYILTASKMVYCWLCASVFFFLSFFLLNFSFVKRSGTKNCMKEKISSFTMKA